VGLKALGSEDLAETHTGRVQAEVTTTGRQDRLIEETTSRLRLERGVRAMSWEILEPNGNDPV